MFSEGGRADAERLAARHHVPVSARSASAGPPASLPSLPLHQPSLAG